MLRSVLWTGLLSLTFTLILSVLILHPLFRSHVRMRKSGDAGVLAIETNVQLLHRKIRESRMANTARAHSENVISIFNGIASRSWICSKSKLVLI